jgi:hypothetical protein
MQSQQTQQKPKTVETEIFKTMKKVQLKQRGNENRGKLLKVYKHTQKHKIIILSLDEVVVLNSRNSRNFRKQNNRHNQYNYN